MAAINFPDPNVSNPETGNPYKDGWYNSSNGVTYVYTNGVWRAASSEQSFEDIFVNKSGDDMTGDLTLSTDAQVKTGDPRTSGASTGGTIIGTSGVGLTRLNIFNNVNTSDVALGIYSGTGTSTKQLRASISTNGTAQFNGGISFDTTAGSDSTNTLGDYEEGNWTPSVVGTNVAGTVNYANNKRSGTYIKVGNLVTVWLICGWRNGTGSGNLSINGLPYVSNQSFVVAMGASGLLNLNNEYAYAYTSATSSINVGKTKTTNPSNASPFPYQSEGDVYVTFSYFTN